MYNIHFHDEAWTEFGWWMENDLKTVRKIYALLQSIGKDPFTGVGKPEPLKGNYSGYWSRRINAEHRLVYKPVENGVVVLKLKGHY